MFRITAFLVRHGVPFDVAHSLDEGQLLAWYIVLGEIEGGSWDWSAMRWEKKT